MNPYTEPEPKAANCAALIHIAVSGSTSPYQLTEFSSEVAWATTSIPASVAAAPSSTGKSTLVVHSGMGSRGSDGGSLGGPVTNAKEQPTQLAAVNTRRHWITTRGFPGVMA